MYIKFALCYDGCLVTTWVNFKAKAPTSNKPICTLYSTCRMRIPLSVYLSPRVTVCPDVSILCSCRTLRLCEVATRFIKVPTNGIPVQKFPFRRRWVNHFTLAWFTSVSRSTSGNISGNGHFLGPNLFRDGHWKKTGNWTEITVNG